MTDLAILENQATEHLEVWKHAYWQFWTILLEIRDTSLWEQSGQETWEGYLQVRWLPELEVSYNRIRQIQAAYPVMRLIHDVTGVTLNEGQIRNLKAVVPESDRYLLPEIVSIASEHTSAPAKRHFEAVYEVVRERRDTNTVNVDGETRVLNITSLAAKEAMIEADKRQRQHIADHSKLQPVDVKIVNIAGNNQRTVITIECDVPFGSIEIVKAYRRVAA